MCVLRIRWFWWTNSGDPGSEQPMGFVSCGIAESAILPDLDSWVRAAPKTFFFVLFCFFFLALFPNQSKHEKQLISSALNPSEMKQCEGVGTRTILSLRLLWPLQAIDVTTTKKSHVMFSREYISMRFSRGIINTWDERIRWEKKKKG